MSELTFDKLRRIAFDNSYSDDYYGTLERIMESLNESDLLDFVQGNDHIFFAKNAFFRDRDIVFYFIDKKSIREFSFQEIRAGQFSTTVRYYPIEKCYVELRDYAKYEYNSSVVVRLEDGVELIFSAADTNDNWKASFSNQVLRIYKNFTE
jgi:hypothetical protein